MNKWWEKLYPLIISLGVSLFFFFQEIKPSIKGYEKVLDGTITFASIIIGFLAALLAIILSLSKSEVVKHLYLYREQKNRKSVVFFSYTKQAIIFGFVCVIISIIMYVMKETQITFILWSFVTTYFVCSSWRIINIIMVVLIKEAKYSRKESIEQKDKLNKEKINQLKKKGAKKTPFQLKGKNG